MSSSSASSQIVLVVDDAEDVRELMALQLRLAGYDVVGARDGRYDLHLLDGRYADGTGVELCERIRRFDPRTPVVFFSGLAQDYDREQALAAGAQAYLVKPNEFGRLADAVTRLLNEAPPAAFASHRAESRGNTLRRRRPAPAPDTQREDSAAAG